MVADIRTQIKCKPHLSPLLRRAERQERSNPATSWCCRNSKKKNGGNVHGAKLMTNQFSMKQFQTPPRLKIVKPRCSPTDMRADANCPASYRQGLAALQGGRSAHTGATQVCRHVTIMPFGRPQQQRPEKKLAHLSTLAFRYTLMLVQINRAADLALTVPPCN